MRLLILINIFLFSVSVYAVEPEWYVNTGTYEKSMVITGVLLLNDSLLEYTPASKVAAFIGSECRGVAEYGEYTYIDGYRASIMIYGNSAGQEITLKVYIADIDTVLNISQSYIFQSDENIGNIDNPEQFNIIVQEWARPSKPVTPWGEEFICNDFQMYLYTTEAVEGADSYIWNIQPESAGSLVVEENQVNVLWNSDFSGIAQLNVYCKNENGNGKLSDTLYINVNQKPATPEISISNKMLLSNSEEGNQWYFEPIGIIDGATNLFYEYPVEGTYYDIVTLDGCSSDTAYINVEYMDDIQVLNQVENITLHVNKEFEFVIPKNVFDIPDDEQFTYYAYLLNGDTLPSWLHFNEKTGTFTGTPPESEMLMIALTIFDSKGAYGTTFFVINIQNTIGVDEISSLISISNNSSTLFVETKQVCELDIYTISGILKDRYYIQNSTNINIAHYMSGLYVLFFKMNNTSVSIYFCK